MVSTRLTRHGESVAQTPAHRQSAQSTEPGADRRGRLLNDVMQMPPSEGSRLLGQLVAISDTDRAARLEVLRGVRDAS